ncbi:MAG: hypothetical protein J5J06_05590 [Phycisphaerae bacterium]|nr:hypothetical protein [Phycisphaerae bacterium]
MPQPTDLSFSPALTKIAVEYQNRRLIADQVLPLMPHSAKSGKFKSYDQYPQFDIEGGLLGPNGQADEIEYKVSETEFAMDDYGLKGWVSQQEINNAEAPMKPMADMTRKVTEKTLRLRERRVALAVLNASNYAAGNQVDVAGGWTTTTTDAWGALLTGLDACAEYPNVMVMDLATFRKLQVNQTILAAIKGTLAPQFIEQTQGPAKTASAFIPDSVFCPALAQALGLDRVVIGGAKYATSKRGQTLTKAAIWDLPNAGKGGAAFLRVAQDQVADVVWGMHLYWQQPLRVLTWFDPDRGADGSTAVKVVETTKIQLVANDAGYLFKDTLVT